MTYNPFTLVGKTILITGASSGIGRVTAIECSKMGAKVIITGRNEHRLKETFDDLEGDGHNHFIAELNELAKIDNLVTNLPNLNGIVHCAGISGHKPFQFLKEGEMNEMFKINFFAPSLITTALLKSNKLLKNSSIVFITSISGIISSYYGGSLYSATKGALNGLIKGMAMDLSPKKIRVNSVMPAMIKTEIMAGGDISQDQFIEDSKKYPLNRYGKPEEVAFAVIYLLSEASSWTTGSNILLDGGRTIAY